MTRPSNRWLAGALLATAAPSALASYRDGAFAVVIFVMAVPAALAAMLLALMLRSIGAFDSQAARRSFVAFLALPAVAVMLWVLPGGDGLSTVAIWIGMPLLVLLAGWPTRGPTAGGHPPPTAPAASRWIAGYWLLRGSFGLVTAGSVLWRLHGRAADPTWWPAMAMHLLSATASVVAGVLLWRRKRGALALMVATIVWGVIGILQWAWRDGVQLRPLAMAAPWLAMDLLTCAWVWRRTRAQP